MKQTIYLGGKARNYDTALHEEIPIIGDCDWKEGEVKTEGVDYEVQLQSKNDYGEWYNTDTSDSLVKCLNTETRTVIVPIPKKQEGQSAATPPDVEQLPDGEDLLDAIQGILYKYKTDEADEGSWIDSKDFYKVAGVIARYFTRYQTGQSTFNPIHKASNKPVDVDRLRQKLQDATPQEWEKRFDEYFEGANAEYAFEMKSWIDENVAIPLRSELSAAHEENKRLKEKMEWDQRYLNEK